jgi:hypothetical protein
MEVKHQVFVSSTFKDLIEERKAVIHALLELDCIPAGMELFPAADEDAWTLIREVIDDCDYYILIVAGKYGSMNGEGVGYTEMEFDYAVSIGKPIICFVHQTPDSLPATHVEKTEALQAKVEAFREKAKAKHCKFWLTADDLGGKVSRSLIQLRKRHPSLGWVPGKYAASESMLRELQELRSKVVALEAEVAQNSSFLLEDVSSLAQGEDKVFLQPTILDENKKKAETRISATWDQLFSYVGASMTGECTDEEMMKKIQLAFYHQLSPELAKHNDLSSIVVPYVIEDRIRVQFQALGLIAPGAKRRAVSDTQRYWRLTSHGEKHLLKIRAVRKSPAAGTSRRVAT